MIVRASPNPRAAISDKNKDFTNGVAPRIMQFTGTSSQKSCAPHAEKEIPLRLVETASRRLAVSAFPRNGARARSAYHEPPAMSYMAHDEQKRYEGGNVVGIYPGMPDAARAVDDRRPE